MWNAGRYLVLAHLEARTYKLLFRVCFALLFSMFWNKLKIINNESFLCTPNTSVSTAITGLLWFLKFFCIIFCMYCGICTWIPYLRQQHLPDRSEAFFQSFILYRANLQGTANYVQYFLPHFARCYYYIVSCTQSCTICCSFVSVLSVWFYPTRWENFAVLRASQFGNCTLNASSFYAYYLKLFNSIREVGHTQIIHDSKHILLHLLVSSLYANYWKSLQQ